MKSNFIKSLGILLLLIPLAVNAQKISPYLVGTNLWFYDPSELVWSLTRECGVKTVRIGGNAYDRNLPSNETLLNWVKHIQAIGAEPIMQVSQYKSPEAAANLVKFFNIEKHEGITPIKFWNIGNEPWLQAGRPDQAKMGSMVEAYFKPIAAAMKAIDPEIKIYGPDFCDYLDVPMTDLFGGKNDITDLVPGTNYYYCDGLVWHRYPQGSGDPAVEGANDFLDRIVKSKARVDGVNALHKRKGENALIWAIGEYNSKSGPEVHSWGNGQMFAAVLGYCMEYGARYATSWSMFEHGGDRKGSDFSLIDGANMAPRSSYWHMQLVAKYFTGAFLKGISSDSSILVFGAQHGDQTSVMILNRGYGESKKYSLDTKDRKKTDNELHLFVEGKRMGIYRDSIQPRTTQLLIFKGRSITRINYSSDDFEHERPPVYSTISK
jgi:hypothetical protein